MSLLKVSVARIDLNMIKGRDLPFKISGDCTKWPAATHTLLSIVLDPA